MAREQSFEQQPFSVTNVSHDKSLPPVIDNNYISNQSIANVQTDED
jgi:hypothetical protein